MADKAPHCGVTHASATTQPQQEKEEGEKEAKKKAGAMHVEAGGVSEQRVNNVKSREITVLGALAFQRRPEDKCVYDD